MIKWQTSFQGGADHMNIADVTRGERYFRGYYMERYEVDSRMRVLARMMSDLR